MSHRFMAYEEALAHQQNAAENDLHGWLLFTPPPTLTVTRRSRPDEFAVPPERLKAEGVRVLSVDRGGRTTYHGPGQIVGFPLGPLKRFVGDSRAARAFVNNLLEALLDFVEIELETKKDNRVVDRSKSHDCPGVWLRTKDGEMEKVAALGLAFHRNGISHGFALNIEAVSVEPFRSIHACGDPSVRVSSLYVETNLQEVSDRLRAKLENSFKLRGMAVDNR